MESEELNARAQTTARFAWRCAAASDVGCVRAQNEDAYRADQECGLFVVADGMGGHAAGEVASALAVRAAAEGLATLSPSASRDEARAHVRGAIDDANQAILIEGRARPEHTGMGTTATILLLSPRGWYVVGHVGDSRAYLARDGEVIRLTEDHTYVQELVNEGRITEEQARTHPRASLLTRALGTTGSVSVDTFDGELQPGDRFLIASDGLTTMLPEERIVALMQESPAPAEIVSKLIEEANAAGGADNTTAIVVDVIVEQGADAEA
ncbi:MAG: Stp1/IreP family PP2C-type Ser/Thr phosphatase [Gemmatimonadota bacterium]